MALAHVQSNIAFQWSGTSLPVAFASNVTAGNLIAVVVFWANVTSTVTVADGLGNTYTAVDNPVDLSTACRASTFYAKNIGGGACTVTVTFSGSVFGAVAVHEISGADTAAPLDQHSIGFLGYIGTDTDAVTASVTTTADGEYILGAMVPTGAGACASGTGFTDRVSTTGGLHTEEKIQTSAGAIAVTFTNTGAQNSGIAIMTFKAPAAGGATNYIPAIMHYARMRND